MTDNEQITTKGREIFANRGPTYIGGKHSEFLEWLKFWAMTTQDPDERLIVADLFVKLETRRWANRLTFAEHSKRDKRRKVSHMASRVRERGPSLGPDTSRLEAILSGEPKEQG